MKISNRFRSSGKGRGCLCDGTACKHTTDHPEEAFTFTFVFYSTIYCTILFRYHFPFFFPRIYWVLVNWCMIDECCRIDVWSMNVAEYETFQRSTDFYLHTILQKVEINSGECLVMIYQEQQKMHLRWDVKCWPTMYEKFPWCFLWWMWLPFPLFWPHAWTLIQISSDSWRKGSTCITVQICTKRCLLWL